MSDCKITNAKELRTPAKKYTVFSNTVSSLQVAILYAKEHT